MNNRFKFRAWDKTENAYIEDAQFTYDDGCEGGMGSFKHYSFRDLLEDKNCIVEQCTGLKDKNGKLIYEGDIVEIMIWDDIEEDMVETKGKVYWSKEDAAFLIYVSYDAEYSLNSYATIYGQEIEVIGNIHENKEFRDE